MEAMCLLKAGLPPPRGFSSPQFRELTQKWRFRSLLICRTCRVTKGTHVLHFITSLSAIKEDLRRKEEAVEEGATQTERQKLKGNKL